MSHRFYYSPIIHCPSLCPYQPPKDLFFDDYAPEREESARKFCTEHCWLASEHERPCMVEFRRQQSRAETQRRDAEAIARADADRLRANHRRAAL